MKQQDVRDLIFSTAFVWRLSPFELEGRPLSDIFELADQIERIRENNNGK